MLLHRLMCVLCYIYLYVYFFSCLQVYVDVITQAYMYISFSSTFSFIQQLIHQYIYPLNAFPYLLSLSFDRLSPQSIYLYHQSRKKKKEKKNHDIPTLKKCHEIAYREREREFTSHHVANEPIMHCNRPSSLLPPSAAGTCAGCACSSDEYNENLQNDSLQCVNGRKRENFVIY